MGSIFVFALYIYPTWEPVHRLMSTGIFSYIFVFFYIVLFCYNTEYTHCKLQYKIQVFKLKVKNGDETSKRNHEAKKKLCFLPKYKSAE